MELIDTHQHLMYRDQVGYSWANEFPPIDKGNFTLEDYKELTKEFEIKGTIFMETGVDDSDYKKETKFIKSIMDQPDSNMKGLIVSIRPEEESGFDQWLEETIDMNVDLDNVGSVDATSLNVVVSTSDPYITLINSSLNSSVPHLDLFSSAFSASEKSSLQEILLTRISRVVLVLLAST